MEVICIFNYAISSEEVKKLGGEGQDEDSDDETAMQITERKTSGTVFTHTDCGAGGWLESDI